MRQSKIRQAIVLFALFLAANLRATTIIAPNLTIVESDDANILVRIEPGDNEAQVEPFNPPFSDRNAIAIFFRYDHSTSAYKSFRTLRLANGFTPAEAHLKNRGEFVTLDNWGGSLLTGPVVAIYSRTGETVAAFSINDLYSPGLTATLKTWRSESEKAYFTRSHLVVPDVFGNYFNFNIYDGSYEYRVGDLSLDAQ